MTEVNDTSLEETRLHALIDEKDAQLAEARALLRRYREELADVVLRESRARVEALALRKALEEIGKAIRYGSWSKVGSEFKKARAIMAKARGETP